jgi:hypothetical protein
MDAYKKTLDLLCPVAIKANQNEIDAPGHDTWVTVTCDGCRERFYIGPSHILEARTTPEDVAIQLPADRSMALCVDAIRFPSPAP